MSNTTAGGLRFTSESATTGNLTVNIGTLNIASNAVRTIQFSGVVNPTGNPTLASVSINDLNMAGGIITIGAVRRSTSDPLNVNLGNITMTGGTINLSDTAGGFSNTILANSLNGTSGTIRATSQTAPPIIGTLRLIGNQTTTFSGALDGTGNRTLALEYAGTGRQTLNGNSTYAGNTTISSGTLQFARTAALYNSVSANWTASRIKVESGGTIAFNVGGTNEFSTGNVTTLLANLGGANGSSTGGLAAGSAIGFDTTNASGSSFTISNNITNSSGSGGGAIGLTKLGTNSLVLTGNNTYTGATTILAGTLTANGVSAIGDTSAVSVSSGAVLNLAANETVGSITGVGNITLGGNTLTVGGDNTSTNFSGNLSGVGGGLAKNGTGTLTLTAENTYTGATAINSGTLQIGTGGATGSLASSSIVNNASLVVDRTGTLTLSGNLSGSGTLTKNGSGTLVLGGSNSYTGSTAINAGAIRATTSNALGSTAAGTTVASGAALELSGGITIGAEALSLAGSGISSAGALRNINGTNAYSGAITLNAATTISSDADTLTLSGGLTGTNTNLTFAGGGNIAMNTSGFSIGTGALTKTGAGTLTLSTNNTYTGSTSILAGTLTANAVSAIGDTSAVSISSGAVLNLGAGETVGSITGAGDISLGGNTLTVGGDNTNTTFSGILSGNGGGLAKTGTGTLTISGTNTFNGSTTINAGTLFVSGNSAASAHAVEVGAVLEGTGVLGATTVNGTLQGTLSVGGLTINPGGIVSPNGNNAVGTLSTSSITINGGGYNWTLANVNSSVAGTDFDQITSTGALAFSGPLIVNIYGNATGWSPANTYSWNIMSGASISGFNSSNFSVNTSNFSPFADGTWSFGSNGGNLTLTYTGLSSPTWNGGTGNWSTGFSPSVANGDNLAFANATTVTATNNIGSGTLSSVGSITFNSGAGNFTLAANNGSAGFDAASALVVNGIVVNNSANNQNVNLALAFSNNASQIQANSGGFVFGNTIDTGIQLALVGGNNVAMNGVVSGSGGISMNGTGTLTLSANNTFSGSTSINSGTLQIGTGGATGSLASSSILNNASLVVDRTGTLTLSGNLSGSGTLTKNGSGTLILSGSNSYTGATAINAGAVRASSSNALGSTAAGTTVASGAALEFSGGITIGAEALSLGGSGISSAGALRNVNGNNAYAGAITLNAATTIGSDADTLTLSGGLTGTNTNLTFAGDGNVAMNTSGFSIGTGTLTKTGAGTLTLSTNNTYTGSTSILAGTLTANAVSAIGDTSAVSISSGAVLNLGAGETVGSVAGAGNITLGGNTLTVGGDNTSTTFSGILSGNGGGLAKAGTGTLTLSGTNTYSGATTINGGTLLVTGNNSASAHTISTGAVLGGSGGVGATTVNGTLQGTLATGGLTINSGGIISPNGNTAVGTISTSSITINGGGYNWTLANVTSSVAGTDFDQITSSGALVFSGPLIVNIYGNATGWNPANTYSWNIMSGSSISGFDSSFFSVNTSNFAPFNDGTWSFGSNGGNLTLTYTGLSSPTWNGGTGNWSTGFSSIPSNGDNLAFANATTVTATNNIAAGTLSSVGSITFNNGAGNFTLAANNGSAGFNAASALVVNGIVVNNSANSQNINLALAFSNNASQIQANSGGFVFGNTIDTGIQLAVVGANNVAMNGVVSGAGGLTMNGTGTLTLAADNTFTGATAINTGTLQIGAGGAIGSLASSSILNNASLVVDRTGTLTLSGNLSGSGTLTKNGSGTLILSGSNSYTGTTAINAGAVRASTSNALGSTAAGTTVASGAALELSGGITIGAEALSLAGSGISSTGALRNINGTNAYSGPITLNAATTIGSDADTLTLSGGLTGTNTNLTFAGSGNITISTSGFSIGTGTLTKTGAGTLTLSANNTYTGGTSLSGGTILISASGALGASGNISFSGGTLQYGAGISTDISTRIKNSSAAIAVDTNGQNATFAGAIDSSNSGGFTKNGIGTLTLSSSGNAYTGNTTVNGGILRVSNNSLGAANATVTVNTGASINLAAVSAVTSSRSLVLSGNGATGLGAIYSTSGGTTWNYNQSGGTMALEADTTIGNYDAASELQFFGASNITGNNATLTIVGNGSVRFNRGFALGATGSLIMNSTGNLSIGATTGSTYNGTTSILNGTVVYLGNNALSDGTAVVINGGSLNIGNRTDTVGSVTLTNGSILGTTGVLTVNAAGGGFFAMQNGTVSAILAGTANLTKTTNGTVTLSGSNTYSGRTVINGGNLSISNVGALGSTSGVSMADGAALLYTGGAGTLGANITITSGTGTLRNSGGGMLNLSGTLTKNGTTLAFGQGAFNVTGSIVGSNASSDLIVDTATVLLNGANTYNGPTYIRNGGSLTANVTNALPTANGRSVLVLDDSGSGSSVLVLGASQSVASLAGAASSNVTLGANTLTIGNSSGNTTFAGRISGSGNLVKDGNSIQVLSGNSSYTGTTTVTAGTLQAASANALGTNATVTVNGGSLLVSDDGALAGKNITLNSSSISVAGLAFQGNYNGTAGLLTLSENSILDLGLGSVVLRFSDIVGLADYTLKIYNWTGETLWGGNDRDNTDQIYVTANLNAPARAGELGNISFYSDFTESSFLGTGFQLAGSGFYDNQIIPVPEPETWATGALLLLWTAFWARRKYLRRPTAN